MKILNTWLKYFGRYFIYAIIGFLTPWAVKSIIGSNMTWEYFALLILTLIILLWYMIMRDRKYFKHEEWEKE